MAGTTFDAAMDALRDGLAKGAANPGLQAVGEYLTERLRRAPGLAPAFTAAGKSLAGAWAALVAEARKRPHAGGVVVLSDAEGFGIACAYYGIPAEGGAAPEAPREAQADALSLDALLDL